VNFERLKEDYTKEVGAIEVWDEDKWRNSEIGKVYYGPMSRFSAN
jgi:hypothetical protein